MNLVFLPATEKSDDTYGQAPQKVGGFPEAAVHEIKYPQLVWYNRNVRSQAIAQIQALDTGPVVLFGFSKSGPGAWNIARSIPELVAATIIFDAPMALQDLPMWGAQDFYKDSAAWKQDSPINSIAEFREAMPDTHRLILISGEGWHSEMVQMSEALSRERCRHTFLSHPDYRHHWDSGWIEEGLRCVYG